MLSTCTAVIALTKRSKAVGAWVSERKLQISAAKQRPFLEKPGTIK